MGNLVADVRAGVQNHHGLQVRDGVREQVRDQVSWARIQNTKFISNTSAKQSGWDKVQVIGIQIQMEQLLIS